MPKLGGDAMSSRQGMPTQVGAAPAARRLGSSRWRDPRLAVGIILVAASVVLGARVVASADDTVPVWSLRHDVPAGSSLTAEDVTVTRVHFESVDDADRYFDGDQTLPSDWVAEHDLVAGELLAESALAKPESRAVDQLSLPVTEGLYPVDLASGDRVDVWVTPDESIDQNLAAVLLLKDVAVLDVDAAGSSLDDTSTVVLVALDAVDDDTLGQLLAAIPSGSVQLIRKGE
jgi:Flp pilus assembly protein CpaB